MKIRLLILGVIAILVSITSCRNNYYVENELHGIWQVISIEEKATNQIIEPQGTLYYQFQRTLVSLCYNYLDVPEKLTNVIAHFDRISPDSIGMGDFRVSTTGEGDNVNKEIKVSVSSLSKFGIYQDYTVFHLLQSKQKMILSSDSARIILRRY